MAFQSTIKYIPTKEELYQCFVVDNMLMEDIAEKFGVSRRTIGRWLEEYDLYDRSITSSHQSTNMTEVSRRFWSDPSNVSMMSKIASETMSNTNERMNSGEFPEWRNNKDLAFVQTLRSQVLITGPHLELSQELLARDIPIQMEYPLGKYSFDIHILGSCIMIEVDGGSHLWNQDRIDRDRCKDQFALSQGFKVLRFWNSEIEDDVELVATKIQQVLNDKDNPYSN